MNAAIAYSTDTASLENIVDHLREADTDFSPTLSSRTDIEDYATKLKHHARLCEAWSDGALVGLVAGYCNDWESRTGFVTNVSVLRRCLRRGVGEQLVRQFLVLAQGAGMLRICLDVSTSQMPARQLYHKLGFKSEYSSGSIVRMGIELSGKTNDKPA